MSDIIVLQSYLHFNDEYDHLNLFPLAMRVLYKYKSIICSVIPKRLEVLSFHPCRQKRALRI